jgi:uncharacterized membrane protein
MFEKYSEGVRSPLWAPISATLCKRVGMTMWHAFRFLGLRLFPLFFCLLGGLHYFL